MEIDKIPEGESSVSSGRAAGVGIEGINPNEKLKPGTQGDNIFSSETGLLFLGTFYHDNNQDCNVDLIQFKEAVKIQEIRIIPLGATVDLSNGSYQLGATNPSELELEFYYNDLKNPNKSTFSVLENFKYQEKLSIHFLCDSDERQILTDGILVRGLYSSLTVATYGHQVDREKIEVNIEQPLETAENMDTSTEGKVLAEEKIESITATGIEEKDNVDRSPSKDILACSNEADKKEVSTDAEFELQSIPSVSPRVSGFTSPVKPQLGQTFTELDLLDDKKIERVSSEEENFDNFEQPQNEKGGRFVEPLIDAEAEDISSSDEEMVCETKDDEGQLSLGADKNGKEEQHETSKEIDDNSVSNIDSGHELLSDQDSFGGDFSDYVEQISDAELDLEEDDSAYWDEFLIDKINVESNAASPAFHISPLQNLDIDTFARDAKCDPVLRKQVIQTVRRYAERNFNNHFIETWVEAMEQILPIMPAALPFIEEVADGIETLGFWMRISLDLQKIKQHATPPLIVRHLKAGLKFVYILCYYFGESLFQSLTSSFLTIESLQWTLICILNDEMLNSGIVQRLVFKIFDVILESLDVWKKFTISGQEGLCIDELLSFLHRSAEPRCAIVMKSLQSKIILANRCSAINKIALDIAENKSISSPTWLEFALHLDELKVYANECLKNDNISSIVVDIADPLKGLLGYNTTVGFFRLLRSFKFMKSLAVVIHHPDFKPDKSIYAILDIFTYIQSSEIGLVYLNSEASCTKLVLMKLGKEFDMNLMAEKSLTSLCLELQVVKDIDTLVDNPKSSEETYKDNISLRRLNSLLFTQEGQEALAKVLSFDFQIRKLLGIIQNNSEKLDKSSRLVHSYRKGYAISLLQAVVKLSSSFEFLRHYGPLIYDVITSFNGDIEETDKLNELLPFLKPTLDPTHFTKDGIERLYEILESKIAEEFLPLSVGSDKNFGFTPEILTILRILAAQVGDCTAEISAVETWRSTKQLGFLENYVEMNSKDLISVLLKIIKKIVSEYEGSGFCTIYLAGQKGDILANLLHPLLKILRTILSDIIELRKSEFRDIEPVESLIQLYRILKLYPEKHNKSRKLSESKYFIVDIIGLCALALSNLKNDEESEDQLKSCMWTRTMAAVFKFTLNSPANVNSGLDLLLELIPKACPVAAKEPLNQMEEQCVNISQRRWGVYMHGVNDEIQELVGTFCLSNDWEILRKLCMFCSTLANLSGSTCLAVCRIIMDRIMSSIENDCESNKTVSASLSTSINAWVNAISDRRVIFCSGETVNSLRFLNLLVKMNSRIKTGVMFVGRASSKLDEKYAPFIGLLCNILANSPSEKDADITLNHTQGQIYVISIFRHFCDCNNSMYQSLDESTWKALKPEQILSNSLPIKENFGFISSALISMLEHIGTVELNSRMTENVLKNLFAAMQVLIGTDYGFHHLKMALLNQSAHVNEFLLKVIEATSTVSSVNDPAAQIACWFIDFVESLTTPLPPAERYFGRQTVLQSFELRKCFPFTAKENRSTQEIEGKPHPFEDLLQNLKKLLQLEPDHETVVKQQRILNLINKDGTEFLVKSEVILPAPDTFTDVFAMQQALVTSQASDLEMELDNLFNDNLQPETVTIDLTDLCQTILKIDLPLELSTVCKVKDLYGSSPSKKNGYTEPKPTLLDEKNFKSPAGGLMVSPRKPITYHTSTRISTSRGFGRGQAAASSRGGGHFDPFRSRPPNTSRPPSLHVDDFVALESSTGPNPSLRTNLRPTPGPGQDQFYQRGRGNRGGMSRPYDPSRGRTYRQHGQMSSPYFVRNPNEQIIRGRGSRGRGWVTPTDARNSPNRGSYGGRTTSYPPPQGDENYRNSTSNIHGSRISSGSVRYSRPAYREAPPSDKMSSSWRDKSRSNYSRQ